MPLPCSDSPLSEARSTAAAMSPFRLNRALKFIEQNLEEPLQLKDIAAAAGLSPPHFRRCFKHDTGYTPYRYTIMKRIDLAKRLLVESDLSMIQIALASGFGSQPRFNAAFKKIVGTSPGLWKQSMVTDNSSRSALLAG